MWSPLRQPGPLLGAPFRLPVTQRPSTRPPRLAALGCFGPDRGHLDGRSARSFGRCSVRGWGGRSLVRLKRKRAATHSRSFRQKVRKNWTTELPAPRSGSARAAQVTQVAKTDF